MVYFFFILAALLEIGGDALVRQGLIKHQFHLGAFGFILLGTYGVVVNLVKWDFSKLLGVYVVFFAILSVLFGKFIFKEQVPFLTWVGLVFISIGGLLIQFSPRP